MKKGFYLKLAWTGIRKNKRLYTPYILTCIGMVMMFYIVSFLSISPVLKSLPGGTTMQSMLSMGRSVIGVFALLFLFYTNSFLIRRRKKEFGLYNILGMGKWNIARILFWESLTIAIISLAGGLAAGILFSKFAELGMVNILHADVSFFLSIQPQAILQSLALFSVIFALILLNTLRQIHLTNPIELLRSGSTGEKPPKANWFFALVGAVILAAAYYLAITIEEPVTALVWFFIAVIMVIVATYLLFIAGSVAVCRILQKNKNYYYKTNHFVSVSSMAYRMKRNGAGLASICVLCTMVLVMLSSTVCLYIGTEDSLRTRYPRHINLEATTGAPALLETEKIEEVRELAAQMTQESGQSLQNVLDYRMADFAGYIQGDRILTDASGMNGFQTDTWQIYIVPLEDYNRLMGRNETLNPGEVLLCTYRGDYPMDTIVLNGTTLQIKKTVEDFVVNGEAAMVALPYMYMVVPDFAQSVESLIPLKKGNGNPLVQFRWQYGFDLDGDDEAQIRLYERLAEGLKTLSIAQDSGELSLSCESAAKERIGFYGLYGGLFFLGILLGVVFILAAVLIMYYKQISEGYEDQDRFEILQKVGMTKREIKKSINSQVLTVFFLPLLAAGVHLAFAFPLIYKMLMLFGLTNLNLLILVNAVCFLLFALFYVFVYRITSKSYYSIVSGTEENA